VALFPQSFIDEVKAHADIVTVIQDYVSLKKTGATYKGLCPFHGEKTPSFHVNRDKGFFHCFGCNVGGDVFKFLELHEKIGFQEAVTQLAQRFGLALPQLEQNDDQRTSSAERETLLKLHDVAATWFRQQLASTAGTRARKQIADRGLSAQTVDALGLGYAPPARDALKQHLVQQGFSQAAVVRSGLAFLREDGSTVDRFRNRLMIPICRDTGSVIAFGGRAMEADQQPKYLNSPETPIYVKGRALYGLNLSKTFMRHTRFAVLVEGYFDFAQVFQSGMQAIVASCGTALTAQQAALLHRFTQRVILSFDPDTAGQGAAEKSCELLVAEGFDVNVAILPPGEDPDTFVQRHGGPAYLARLRESKPYLEYLLDTVAARHDLKSDEGRVKFFDAILPVAGRIPDAAARDRFAERIAFKAQIREEVAFAEIRRAVVQKQTSITAKQLPTLGQPTKAERDLLWWLVHRSETALEAFALLDDDDLVGLASRGVLDLVRKLKEDKGFSPAVLLERLNDQEAALVTRAAAESEPPALAPASCVYAFRKLRYERERADVQREIDHLQRTGQGEHGDMNALLARKGDLGRLIQSLVISEE
jgi:DNA primase